MDRLPEMMGAQDLFSRETLFPQFALYRNELVNLIRVIFLILTVAASAQTLATPPAPQAVRSRSSAPRARKSAKQTSGEYGLPTRLAFLKDNSVKESSGLAASRNVPGVYWTHNDSGDGPFIYAFDGRGNRKGVWRVAGASAFDWEDMSTGPGPVPGKNYLYIGDIGDNQERRTEIVVYRVPEPAITGGNVSKSKAGLTEPAEIIRLRYPDGKHDAEALLVHPQTGNIYIVTKVPFANPGIYEAAAPLATNRKVTLARIGTLEVPSLLGGIITGGAISPDGRRVAFCDYMQGYEAVLPDAKATFSAIWKQPLHSFGLGNRKQGEAITYRLDGKALLATSEGSPMPLFEVVRR